MRSASFAIALSYMVSIGCVSTPTATRPTTETPLSGGRVIEGGFADVKTLQPVLVGDLVSARVTQKIYDTLWRADPRSGELSPNLGRWTIDPDGKTYHWEIDARAEWSDGRPIVGEDFLTAVKAQARSKLTTRKSDFEPIQGFAEYRDGKATTISGISVDGKRFSVRFLAVSCPALVNTFGPAAGPLPTHIFGRYTVDDDTSKTIDSAAESVAPPVSSGPFLFKEWRRGDQIILTRNPRYFRGAALLAEYVHKVVADTNVLALQLRTGELDIGAITPGDLAEVERDPRLSVHRYEGLRYTFIGWDLRSRTAPALSDKRVRQALAYGLDVDAFIRSALLGQGRRMAAHHLPSSWAFPSSALQPYPYDRAKAEALISEAGYARGGDGYFVKDGRPFGLSIVTFAGSVDRVAFLEIAAEQYRQIGVRVEVRTLAAESLIDKLAKGTLDADAWISGWVLGVEPDPYRIWHSSQIPSTGRSGLNSGGFAHAAVDRALEDARTGNCARSERRRHYETFNRILNEEQPYNFGFAPLTLVAANATMRGFSPGPFNEWPEIEKWWYAR